MREEAPLCGAVSQQAFGTTVSEQVQEELMRRVLKVADLAECVAISHEPKESSSC